MQDLLNLTAKAQTRKIKIRKFGINYYLWQKKTGFEHLAEKVFEIEAKFIQQKKIV